MELSELELESDPLLLEDELELLLDELISLRLLFAGSFWGDGIT